MERMDEAQCEVEKQIFGEERRFEEEIFELVCRDIYHYSNFLNIKKTFLISLDKLRVYKFARKMKSTAIPDLNQINFRQFPPRNKRTTSLISSCFPRSVKRMAAYQQSCFEPIRRYFAEFIRIAPKVQHEILFRSFTINDREFKRIMSAVRHVRVVYFVECEISVTKVPDFSFALAKTRLENFCMMKCSYGHKSNLEQNSREFKNFIKGLSSSNDLKQSLKCMIVKSQTLEIGDIKSTLNENGFKDIKLFL
ncbi:unnamed protein product [Moneuplotes crassus]|uniref:Uncharacterized protein n=1 Tax=Euplotes crassus TaxID=5936 RepID=A0AAD1XIX1_EUPCR|nr:unnamed protein product [Moneuplotes crassus]